MSKKIFIGIIWVILLLPLLTSATTYYVSRVDGSDSYNGLYPTYEGGSNGPWKTLAKSVSSISSGDTVYLRGGTWQDEQLSIVLKNYASTTTFKAYTGETPIIDMRNSGTTSSAKGILIDRSNNVRVEGITVRNSGYISIYAASSHNFTIVNCTTEHSRLTGIHVTLCSDFDVSYNLVKYTQCPATNHDHDTWTGFSEECISIEASSNGNVHHNRVYKLIDSWGGEGINVKNGASYIYVYNNLVDHALENGQESTRQCMGVDAWTEETHHIYLYNNILKNGAWGIIFNSEEGGYAHHLYAWNNIISHVGYKTQYGGGIGFPGWGNSPGMVEYGYFWNNIIYDSYYGAFFNKEEISAPIEVRNNIFYNSVAADIKWGDSPQGVITLDHNLVGTDPKFVNPSGGNFHLQSNSSAINAGVTIPDVTDDYDGIARPQGASYDIGAYEYVSGTQPPSCTEVDWNYTDGECQANNTLIRTWIKINTNCEGGVTHPATETTNCTYVPPTIPGDLNNDGKVNVLDLSIVASDFGKTSNFNNPKSDTDNNNIIDIFDIVYIASRFT